MPDLANQLRDFGEDRTSGSSQLVRQARLMLQQALREWADAAPSDFRERWEPWLRALVGAHPSLASLRNLANRAALILETSGYDPRSREHLLEMLAQWDEEAAARLSALAQHARCLFPVRGPVLVYSQSGSVLEILKEARRHAVTLEAICSEGRPKYEGREMARKLVEAGIAVRVLTDAALFDTVPEAGMVLVGADAFLPGAFVNKVGTASLFHLACLFDVARYVASTEDKCLPAALARQFEIESRDPAEVWAERPEGVTVHNRYFDRTPLELCTAIVTETGIHTPASFRSRVGEAQVARALAIPP
ncbi:MAG: hypothetical protein HY652_03335 [Acidobacteria bacterium]|nr:hypothetical protein [Acidobacteriota bacterium]